MFNVVSDIHIEMWLMTNSGFKYELEQFFKDRNILWMKGKYKDFVGALGEDAMAILNSIIYKYSMEFMEIARNTCIPTDYLFILGDLSNMNLFSFAVLKACSKLWKNVYWIDGNHEYYFQDINEKENRVEELLELTKDLKNVTYIGNKLIKLNIDNEVITFGGLEFSYNVINPNVQYQFFNIMNDSKFMRMEFIKEKHDRARNFYNEELFKEANICMSHVPILKQEFKNSRTSRFGEEVEETTYRNVFTLNKDIYYMSGHTHSRGNVEYNECIGYSTGIGYPGAGNIIIETFECKGSKVIWKKAIA